MPRGTGNSGPHPVDRHVGRRVCEKRISLGYNQSELGKALGLTFQQIQKYEKGANRISASKLWEIARFFKLDIAYFLRVSPTTSQSTAPLMYDLRRLAKASKSADSRPPCPPVSKVWF